VEHWWNNTEKGKPKDRETHRIVLRGDLFTNSHRGLHSAFSAKVRMDGSLPPLPHKYSGLYV
jgi:hypothetical protein